MLLVIGIAMAMLWLLVAHVTRQGRDAEIVRAATRQRALSEQLVASALAARSAPQDENELLRRRIEATSREWHDAAMRLHDGQGRGSGIQDGTPAARDYAALLALKDTVQLMLARVAQPRATTAQVDSLMGQQRRFVAAMAHVVDELESQVSDQVDRLVQLEAVCVILLLLALGFGLRLALQPAQDQLNATVDALAESESRTRAVLDAMQEGMLLVDAQGQVLTWNPSALRILDLPEDATADDIQKVALRLWDEHGEQLGADRLPNRLAIQGGVSVVDVTMMTTGAAGELKVIHGNTHPLYRGESETPHAAVTIFRDVTAARRLEEERVAQADALETQNRALLEQAEQLGRGSALFRSLVETAGSAIIGLNPDGRVFEWNREAETLFGVSRENAIGRDYAADFVTPEHRERMRNGITSVFGGRPIKNLVGPVKSASGERHTVLWNITPLHTGDGEPAHGIIAAGLDITEREASDERFRFLFERSSDAHMLYDAEGVIDCNEATLRMLHLTSKTALVGRRPGDFSPLRQPDGRLSVVVASQMREQARLFGHFRFEWTHSRDDGSEFPVEVTLTPLRLHGRDVFLGVWHDIAERKAVEDALRMAKDAAESANKTKSEFMTRMNHELRTPLTAIIGFSRVLLQGRAAGTLTPGAQLYAERIRDNGMHLLSLINQILDVARVEAGRMGLDPETVLVDVIVNEVRDMLEHTAEAKGITLQVEMPALVAPIQTDAGKLRQILINLVGNAIKFTGSGRVLIAVAVDPETNMPTEIAVHDNGIGIPADRLTKIFEPFEQGDSSTRRQFGGTGLGLSIVKTFAHLMGGTIEVASELGSGSTFTLRLPRYEPQSSPTPDVELTTAEVGGSAPETSS
ncbi:MAG: PAS domain S-box protein [bacterium]